MRKMIISSVVGGIVATVLGMQPAQAAVVLHDTFSDADGTALSAHTVDVSSTETTWSGSGAATTILGNAAKLSTNGWDANIGFTALGAGQTLVMTFETLAGTGFGQTGGQGFELALDRADGVNVFSIGDNRADYRDYPVPTIGWGIGETFNSSNFDKWQHSGGNTTATARGTFIYEYDTGAWSLTLTNTLDNSEIWSTTSANPAIVGGIYAPANEALARFSMKRENARAAELDWIQVITRTDSAPPTVPSWIEDPIVVSNELVVGIAYTGTVAGKATEPNGDSISFSKASGPAWLTVAGNGALSGTPVAAGTNTFTVTATDVDGSTNATLHIVVRKPTPLEVAPRITKDLSYNMPVEKLISRGAVADRKWYIMSTGLYAASNDVITVTVDPAILSKGMNVKLGIDQQDLNQDIALNQTTVQFTAKFDGIIHIMVPPGVVAGQFDVSFDNVIETPHFVLGRDTNAAWINTIRDMPGLTAEIEGYNMIITVPRSQTDNLVDVEEVARFWDDIVAAQDDMSTIAFRTYQMRMITMDYLPSGGANSNYPIRTGGYNLTNMARIKAGDAWGAIHEIGHQHEHYGRMYDPDSYWWNAADMYEVANNFFGMYSIDTVCDSHDKVEGMWKKVFEPEGRLDYYTKAVSYGGYNERNPAGGGDQEHYARRLTFFKMLQVAFGWDTMDAHFQSYLDDYNNNPSALPQLTQADDSTTNKTRIYTQWMTRLSYRTGFDLSPYFQSWSMFIDPAAVTTLNNDPSLTPWNYIEVLDDVFSVVEGSSVVVSNLLGNDFSLEGSMSVVSVDTPTQGTLQDNGDGTWTYTSTLGFVGKVTAEYTVENGYGNAFSGTIIINVDRADGLMAYYSFESADVSGSTVKDKSGNNRDGTVIDIKTTGAPGTIGESFEFDGEDDSVSIPALDITTDTFTITGWVKRNGDQPHFAPILPFLTFKQGTNKLKYDWPTTGGDWHFDPGYLIPDNTWTFIGLVVEPNRARLYMNTQYAVNNTTHPAATMGVLSIAGIAYDDAYEGWIDEVSVWNRSLSHAEMVNLFNNCRAMWNQSPEFDTNPISASDATAGESYQDDISGTVHDQEHDPVSYLKTGGPTWLTIAADGVLSGTPSAGDIGPNSWTVEVSDGIGGTDQAILDILVNAAPTMSITYELNGNDFILSWSGSAGLSYSVLSKTNLTDAVWMVEASDRVMNSYTVTVDSVEQKFFQVR